MTYFVILSKSTNLPELTVTCPQDDGGSNDYEGTYFLLDAPDGSLYYVWFDEDADPTDPAIAGRTGVEIDYSANDTGTTIAGKIETAIHALGDFTASSAAAVATINYSMSFSSGTSPVTMALLEDADYDDALGWVGFKCDAINDAALQKNTAKHLASHGSYRIVTGSFIQSQTLDGVYMFNTGTTESSEYYNAVKEFLLRHMALGTSTEYKYPLYLHIYNPALGNQRIKWMDDDETMQYYCRVFVKGFNFSISTDTLYYEGKIKLEEAWS